MKQNMTAVPVCTVEDDATESRLDVLAVEEPLQIYVDGEPVGITMRTPGQDADLARGLLYNEGVIDGAADVESISTNEPNILRVSLVAGKGNRTERMRRTGYANSSCGICGKVSLEALKPLVRAPVSNEPFVVRSEVIHQLPERLRAHQAVFERTGGLHAAALFTTDGQLLDVREDIGRHNAVDKLIGAALLEPERIRTQSILFVSGRAGFELAQKAVTGGIPVLAAVGAPSSLAVETALRFGMTLVGFVRENRFNIYTGASRIR